jgi:hypothetical protein
MNPIRVFTCAVLVCAAPVYADKNWEQPTDVIILPPETRPAQVYTQDIAPPVPPAARRSEARPDPHASDRAQPVPERTIKRGVHTLIRPATVPSSAPRLAKLQRAVVNPPVSVKAQEEMNAGARAYVFCCGGVKDSGVVAPENRVPLLPGVFRAERLVPGQVVDRRTLLRALQTEERVRYELVVQKNGGSFLTNLGR